MEDIPTEHGRRLLVFGTDFYRVEVRRLVLLFCWYIPGAVFVFLPIIWRKHAAVFVSFLIIWNKNPEAWRLVFGFC